MELAAIDPLLTSPDYDPAVKAKMIQGVANKILALTTVDVTVATALMAAIQAMRVDDDSKQPLVAALNARLLEPPGSKDKIEQQSRLYMWGDRKHFPNKTNPEVLTR